MSKVFIQGSITGHASPIWKKPGRSDKDDLNLNLSVKRAEEAETFVQELFKRKLHDKGIEVEFALECTKEQDFDNIQLPITGVGDSVTLVEANGNENANDDFMRRADINISLIHQIEAKAGMSVNIHIPKECEDNATDQWAIKLLLSGGVGHAGAGVAGLMAIIKNRKTNQRATGFFGGFGLGIGLQNPGVTIDTDDEDGWVNFKTKNKITFDHFDGTRCLFASAGAGFLLGYSVAFLSFPNLEVNPFYVGGFNAASIGADASINKGLWRFQNFPGARCIPAKDLPGEEFVPYTFNIQDNLKHTILFKTEKSKITDEEMIKLEEFINHIVNQI